MGKLGPDTVFEVLEVRVFLFCSLQQESGHFVFYACGAQDRFFFFFLFVFSISRCGNYVQIFTFWTC